MFELKPLRLFLLLFSLLLGACASTKPLGEWITPDHRGEGAGKLMVVAALERITRRRAFEDYLVDAITVTGAEAKPSYQWLAASMQLSRGALEQAIRRDAIEAVLLMKMVPVDDEKPYRQPQPAGEGALYAYHDRAFEEAASRRRGPTAIETSLFDARSGRLTWSMQSAVMEPSQPRHFIEAHLTGVIERMQRAGLIEAPAE